MENSARSRPACRRISCWSTAIRGRTSARCSAFVWCSRAAAGFRPQTMGHEREKAGALAPVLIHGGADRRLASDANMTDRLHYMISAARTDSLGCARRLLVCAALTSLLSGCTKIAENAAPPATATSGVLRVGSYEDLDSLNPVLSDELFVTSVCQFIYSGLIDYDDHGSPVPDVALEVPTHANGLISRDGRRIT